MPSKLQTKNDDVFHLWNVRDINRILGFSSPNSLLPHLPSSSSSYVLLFTTLPPPPCLLCCQLHNLPYSFQPHTTTTTTPTKLSSSSPSQQRWRWVLAWTLRSRQARGHREWQHGSLSIPYTSPPPLLGGGNRVVVGVVRVVAF